MLLQTVVGAVRFCNTDSSGPKRCAMVVSKELKRANYMEILIWNEQLYTVDIWRFEKCKEVEGIGEIFSVVAGSRMTFTIQSEWRLRIKTGKRVPRYDEMMKRSKNEIVKVGLKEVDKEEFHQLLITPTKRSIHKMLYIWKKRVMY